jgi:hypothetical protein
LTATLDARAEPTRVAQVFVELAHVRLDLGREAEAVVAANQAAALDPGDVRVIDVVARTAAVASRPHDPAFDHAFDNVFETEQTEERAPAPAAATLSSDAPSSSLPSVDVVELVSLSQQETLLDDAGSEDTERNPRSGSAIPVDSLAPVDSCPADVDDGRATLADVQERVALGTADALQVRAGLDASVRANDAVAGLDLVDAWLKTARAPSDTRTVAAYAGRVAVEHARDFERAATLFYVAHQADPDDVEVRLDLTRVYASIPRLAGHAVTGILQLLRRAPDDARVFALAADLAAAQRQPDRARAMRSVENMLSGRGPGPDSARFDTRVDVVEIDVASIQTRLAPTGFGSAFHQLLLHLGPAIEAALCDRELPSGVRPVVDLGTRYGMLLERADRLLPGRALRLFLGPVDRMQLVVTTTATSVVVPESTLVHGDVALSAALLRAVAIVRLGGALSELLPEGGESVLLPLLQSALLGDSGGRAARVREALTPETRVTMRSLAQAALAGDVDVVGTLNLLARCADRFALVASGSLPATLAASALPTMWGDSGAVLCDHLRASSRALDLCAYAARDNAWLLRRLHKLEA